MKEENPGYLTRQLITYIGNKRRLLPHIGRAVELAKKELRREKIRVLDAFAGSGAVSRYLKRHAAYLAAIDLEDYAAVAARCHLANRDEIDAAGLRAVIDELNAAVDTVKLEPGFIEELYAPRDEKRITENDRVFYTRKNARRLDNYRRLIEGVDARYGDLLLGPLLSEASIHANTSGVFKGFHKDRFTKIGRFGGTNADALRRIRGDVALDFPVLSDFSCSVEVFSGDANAIAPGMTNLDLVYLDPPYNQHPYGSNYFMLNLLANYQRPAEVSRVSGIPRDWRRSGYNVKSEAAGLFRALVNALDAKYLLVSFNNEGFISHDEMLAMLEEIGDVRIMDIDYNTFRGCRNIARRPLHVTEYLFLVRKE